jgi:hypothetical protein
MGGSPAGSTQHGGHILSTTNPTWPDPGSNPSRRGGEPATNRLSYGAACFPNVTHSHNIQWNVIDKTLLLFSAKMYFV